MMRFILFVAFASALLLVPCAPLQADHCGPLGCSLRVAKGGGKATVRVVQRVKEVRLRNLLPRNR
jgi:hypothetical protein